MTQGVQPALEHGTIGALLRHAGRTYADEVGIRLVGTPAPLFKVLVLSTLLAAGSAERAHRSVLALRRAGLGAPWRMRDADPDVLSAAAGPIAASLTATATALGEDYHDDLRLLRQHADGDPRRVRALVAALPGVGPAAADVFCREVQTCWPELRPWFDATALRGAETLGLPGDAHALAGFVRPGRLAELAAALVRVADDAHLAEAVRTG